MKINFLKQLLVKAFLVVGFFGQLFPSTLTVSAASGQTVTLDGDYYLGANSAVFTPYHEIIINNTSGGAATATLDGQGHTIYFPYNTATPSFSFTTNPVELTLTNVRLENYDPAAVTFLSTSKFIFGDDCKIVLRKNISIGVSDLAWTTSGNATLDGMDHTLTVSGDQQLDIHGLGQSLTLQNLILKPHRPESISLNGSLSKLVLENCIVEIPRDGWAITDGSVDIEGVVTLKGVEKTYFATPTTGELETRLQNLGFGLFDGHCEPTTFSLGASDDATFTAVRISKEDKAYYTENTDPYAVTWTEITGANYLSIDVGTDGQIWVVRTDNTVHRVTKGGPPTLTAATGQSADYVSVGSADHVFILNSSGQVYKNDDPTGTPTSWTLVDDVSAPRSIAAGSDGTLWFVDSDGRVKKKTDRTVEVIHFGTNRDFQKIAAAGTKNSNYVAVLSSGAKGGRIVICKDNGPFQDLGIFKVTDMTIGAKGTILATFDSDLITEDATFGRPVYSKIETELDPLLTMDRTLTFSSAGTMTVKSGATLKLEDDAQLRNQADTSGDAVIQDTRRHIALEDDTSTIFFDGASLNTGKSGLSFENGRLIFKGLNYLYSSLVTDKQFELGTDVQTIVRDSAILNIMGPIDYLTASEMKYEELPTDPYSYPNPTYFLVDGVNEATAKTGVTDPVTLQAITDAYAQGFMAPGTNVQDRIFFKVAVCDSSANFAERPTLLIANNQDPDFQVADRYDVGRFALDSPFLKQWHNWSSINTGVLDNRKHSIDISIDGYFCNFWTVTTGVAHQGHYYVNQIWGSRFHVVRNQRTTTRASQNVEFYVGTSDFLIRRYEYAVSDAVVGSIEADVNVTTLDGTRGFQSMSAGFDETLWYVPKGTNNLIKREPGGSEATITLPGGFSGDIVCVSAAGTTSSNYLVIASSTGQGYIKKDNGAWFDLGLSGLVEISVGVRGTIAVLVKHDAGVGDENICMVRPGE